MSLPIRALWCNHLCISALQCNLEFQPIYIEIYIYIYVYVYIYSNNMELTTMDHTVDTERLRLIHFSHVMV